LANNAKLIMYSQEDYQNEHHNQTGTEIGFFLIEIKAFRIGNSDAAPQFKIIESPNEWSKEIKKSVASGELNRSQTLRLSFWENLNNVLEQRKDSGLKTRKPTTDHWYNFSLGSGQCHTGVDLVDKDGFVRVNVWISNNKDLYDFIYKHKEEVEQNLQGIKIKWDRKDGKKASTISTIIDGLSLDNAETYNELANKIIDMAVRYKKIFAPIVKKFKE